MAVPRDNVREWSIGEKTYQLEASLGTKIVYQNEFFGKLEEPYKGLLEDDILQVYHRSRPFEEIDGEVKPNPDYVGNDIEALLRIAWAMARAAGSTKRGYDKFLNDVIHQPAGMFEEASLYDVVIMRLGEGIIFRRPEGQDGAAESDEAEE